MSENRLRFVKGLLFDLVEFGTDIDAVARNIVDLVDGKFVDRDVLQKMVLGELSSVVDPYKQRQVVAVSVKIADYLKGGK